ncbi:hypothetical protein PIB30_059723 [Stylosanthes scabra]|uniref:NB-ARC domain-containing protein n=1 Tax=Stylosanthes scabra TaxID=79078 RepID=A0ABU6ZJ09_9FABA|nr:hypothetical protein [Stylosanthes scabra]
MSSVILAIYDNVQGRIINKTIEYAIDQWELVWDYETRFEELRKAAETIKTDKRWVQDKAEEEEDRYGRAIYDYVNKWLAQVDDVVAEYNKFKEEHDNNGGYPLDFYFQNVHKRHHRSKIAKDMKKKAEEVQNDKPQGITHWQGPLSKGFALCSVDFEELESRVESMNEITKALEDSHFPSATMIGVHGLAGVGKTTLVIEAARRVQNRDSKLFDLVIMANLGKILDIRKTQGHIADMLGITLQEENYMTCQYASDVSKWGGPLPSPTKSSLSLSLLLHRGLVLNHHHLFSRPFHFCRRTANGDDDAAISSLSRNTASSAPLSQFASCYALFPPQLRCSSPRETTRLCPPHFPSPLPRFSAAPPMSLCFA